MQGRTGCPCFALGAHWVIEGKTGQHIHRSVDANGKSVQSGGGRTQGGLYTQGGRFSGQWVHWEVGTTGGAHMRLHRQGSRGK